jgi:hypothetical protein
MTRRDLFKMALAAPVAVKAAEVVAVDEPVMYGLNTEMVNTVPPMRFAMLPFKPTSRQVEMMARFSNGCIFKSG